MAGGAPDGIGPCEVSQAFAGRALGSPLRLTVTNAAPPTARAAWAAVRDEFDAVDGALSGYRMDSAVARLNARAGVTEPRSVEARLYAALAAADRAWRTSAGRFDPRVGEALARLGQPGPLRILPAARRDASAAWVGSRWLVRDPRRRAVAVTSPVDLHGIGKGLALRWALARVAAILGGGSRIAGNGGPAGFLLEAGGDLVARRPGPTEPDWLIGIEDPAGSATPIAVVTVGDGAICTSSVRRSRWRDPLGREVHHLIDPATGEPGGEGLLAVTVAAPDAAWAEVRTKELFLSGGGAIADLARRRDLAAWWVTADGALRMTAAARQRTRWA